GERPEPAPPGERVREPQVASLARLAIELRERDLDLGMAVGTSRGVVAEHVVDQIGKAAGAAEEGAVAPRPRGCDSRLDQMPRAIEFVAHLQVGPAPGGIDHLAPAIQISVGRLGGRDELDRLACEAVQLVRWLAVALPRERLEPLVDVRVAEDHASPLARAPSRRNSEVVESSGPFELLAAAK